MKNSLSCPSLFIFFQCISAMVGKNDELMGEKKNLLLQANKMRERERNGREEM